MDPGSGIGFFRIPNPYFCELGDICGYKKVPMTTNFSSPLSFVAVFASGIRDKGWVKIRIRDKNTGSTTLKNCYRIHNTEKLLPTKLSEI
jgi:hypothetical protein